MIINGSFIADLPYENYMAASWDRRRPQAYRREHHPPFMRRVWNQAGGYGPAEHATRIWTKFMGMVRISRDPT